MLHHLIKLDSIETQQVKLAKILISKPRFRLVPSYETLGTHLVSGICTLHGYYGLQTLPLHIANGKTTQTQP